MASIENLDLESGCRTSQEDAGLELLWSKRSVTKFSSSDLGVFLSSKESIMCKCGNQSSSNLDKYSQVRSESGEVKVEISSQENRGQFNLAEKAYDNERPRNTNSRNALKPPRPPKGPSLDAADQKLVREIVEFARRKRARIEQIKAAKKTKATKSSSVQSGISAMIFTLLFFCVIIFQGISSTTVPNMNTQGSPEPAVATTGDLTFLHYSQSTIPRSSFQNSVKYQVSRSGPAGKVIKM
uniref:uncharacterized protein LOC101292166 n=1 Tax=Fragaria vesca subsp. vesca TaxID=101020 RepID=UPI0005C9F7C5|nr:PREDICTED: uncharacterized protein LOC101292166 [Fragaria vesca subsp. vesca]XP_011468844.1 PREDICTED: uncharacterized protein LOC101292166 [Fragaria vesca subsp. vesca]XP_011468847.1 PREDICTED: uncharacterized protein LOC101292166 [Fragaria vesca subsp. vesca]